MVHVDRDRERVPVPRVSSLPFSPSNNYSFFLIYDHIDVLNSTGWKNHGEKRLQLVLALQCMTVQVQSVTEGLHTPVHDCPSTECD